MGNKDALEKQGHQRHATQHIGDLANVESRCWGGLVMLLNIPLVHRSRTGQVQLFEGAVEYQRDSDIVLAVLVGVTGSWLPSVRGSQVTSEKQLGAGNPTLLERDL